MANVLIGFGNKANDMSFNASFGSWNSSLPKDNIKSPILGKVARSTDATLASTQFAVNLLVNHDIRVVALCNHNFSSAAQVRITNYSEITHTTLANDYGWQSVWGNAFTSGLTGFDDTSPGGTLPHGYDFSIYAYQKLWTNNHFNWNYIFVIPGPITSQRFWKIEINDTTNSAGYVQIGRLFIGGGWEPTYNFDFGQSVGWNTNTAVQYSKGGVPFFDVKKATRKAKFTLSHSSQIEAMQAIHTIVGMHGLDRELIYIQDREQTQDIHRTAFLGRLKDLPEIEISNYGDNYRSSWEIVETL